MVCERPLKQLLDILASGKHPCQPAEPLVYATGQELSQMRQLQQLDLSAALAATILHGWQLQYRLHVCSVTSVIMRHQHQALKACVQAASKLLSRKTRPSCSALKPQQGSCCPPQGLLLACRLQRLARPVRTSGACCPLQVRCCQHHDHHVDAEPV